MSTDRKTRLEFLTVEEFAELTHRTPSAVRASILRGEIPANKLGTRRWFIRVSDIEALFDGKKRR